ncbi:MAG TPA: GAF domain-containing protein [Methylophilaceae bacterium]|nr:GAF domain-containing protein [Methylophilaceae bacterium]
MQSQIDTELKEMARIQALIQLSALDSPYEAIFDTITAIASDVCETPISLISLVDEKRQWFKSNVGLPGITETDREYAFCAQTIKDSVTLEIEDATQDERFFDNPLVTGDPAIRFYCGAPILLPMGETIGTLCVIDRKANVLNTYQKKTLEGLAKLVSQLLVARAVNHRRLANIKSRNT